MCTRSMVLFLLFLLLKRLYLVLLAVQLLLLYGIGGSKVVVDAFTTSSTTLIPSHCRKLFTPTTTTTTTNQQRCQQGRRRHRQYVHFGSNRILSYSSSCRQKYNRQHYYRYRRRHDNTYCQVLYVDNNSYDITKEEVTVASSSSEEINIIAGREDKAVKDSSIFIPIPKLTVLLPAYNEEKRIIQTLKTYTNFLQNWNYYSSFSSTLYNNDGLFYKNNSSSSDGDDTKMMFINNENNNNNTYIDIDILVVNDGSTDKTEEVVKEFSNEVKIKSSPKKKENIVNVACLSLNCNVGKGEAISRGIKEIHYTSRSSSSTRSIENTDTTTTTTDDTFVVQQQQQPHIVLIADADGSGNISCLDNMIQALINLLVDNYHRHDNILKGSKNKDNNIIFPLWSYPGMIVGNRGYNGIKSIKRLITRWGFRTCVKVILMKNIFSFDNIFLQKQQQQEEEGRREGEEVEGRRRRPIEVIVDDTQCGFKLITLNKPIVQLYSNLHLKRWTYDVEVIYRAICGITTITTKEGEEAEDNDNDNDGENKKNNKALTTEVSGGTSSTDEATSPKIITKHSPILKIPINQIPIIWNDIDDGSKLVPKGTSPIKISLIMLYEILVMRIKYDLGIWK